MRRVYQLACSATAAAVVWGSEAVAQAAGFTTRDSAVVTIVENREPAWSAADRWRFGAQPLLDIGELDGDPEHELHRVVGALRLPDGRIVVANSGTYQLRFFDENGAYIFDCGGRGGGPGEFSGLGGVALFRIIRSRHSTGARTAPRCSALTGRSQEPFHCDLQMRWPISWGVSPMVAS